MTHYPGIQHHRRDMPSDMMICTCGYTSSRGEIPVHHDPGRSNCRNDDAIEGSDEYECPGCFGRDTFTRVENDNE